MKTLTLKSSAQLLLALLFLFFPLYLNAQEEETQSCNRNRGVTALFGSPIILSGTQVYEGVGFLLGGNGAIVFNDAFFIGMEYNALLPTRRVTCPIPDHDSRHHLFGIYGGLFFGHTLFSNNPLRFTGDMLIGLGNMTWNRPKDRRIQDEYGHTIRPGTGFRHPRSPLFMVLEPRVVMEWKLDREVGISLGVSYRYCPFFRLQYEGVDVVPRTAFNGISVSLAFTIHSRRR